MSTGGRLIHVSGGVQHLRPADGGVVTVENIRYVEGIFDVVSECVGLRGGHGGHGGSWSSPAASQLVKVVVRKDGHRFCTHIGRDGAARVQLESPEQQSSGRTQEGSARLCPCGMKRPSETGVFSRGSDQKRSEAGFLHSSAAQRRPNVLQLLRADRRIFRSSPRAHSRSRGRSLTGPDGRMSVLTVFQVMFLEGLLGPPTMSPAQQTWVHFPLRHTETSDLQNHRFSRGDPVTHDERCRGSAPKAKPRQCPRP